MLKMLALMLLLSAAFAAGYWAGQRPVGQLRQAVADVSHRAIERTTELTRKAVETTSDVERHLRRRQGMVDAKDRVIQAKSDLLDKNYGSAAKHLDTLVADLERLGDAGKQEYGLTLTAVLTKAKEARNQLAAGKPVRKGTLEEIQKGLDELSRGD